MDKRWDLIRVIFWSSFYAFLRGAASPHRPKWLMGPEQYIVGGNVRQKIQDSVPNNEIESYLILFNNTNSIRKFLGVAWLSSDGVGQAFRRSSPQIPKKFYTLKGFKNRSEHTEWKRPRATQGGKIQRNLPFGWIFKYLRLTIKKSINNALNRLTCYFLVHLSYK